MPSSISRTDPKTGIRKRALAEGFDVVRFGTSDAPMLAGERLSAFLAEGRQGDMDWMERTADRRADPRVLWPEARSVVVLGMNYGPAHDPLEAVARRDAGAISVYAQGVDYHDVIKARLKNVARTIAQDCQCEVRVFVDTAPVMEKPIAQGAGVGWQGKHTNLVSRDFGSWLFLGSIFTTLLLEPDAAESDHCGQCSRCLDICPTKAFPAPYQLDARRCISYLTIEHKGHIPREFREAIGNRIYGCDDCLAVCPWNKFAQLADETRFHPRAVLQAPLLRELARLDNAAFREFFRKSPVKRIGRDRFVRNVLIAIGNSGVPCLAVEAERLLDDLSPLVRAMAVWALGRLGVAAQHRHRALTEADDAVRAEWALT
ncbi:MAG: tRNA epoxyqueuosine(34) reductase QueG [Alphaproteobacteria bacterium]|nr:tRNA epoxyqueuosine(34) reductase QueG [Alphaproteobacteria bacterium]MBL6939407.1 tRNA epoxyqueuosine(34) reductase QueG [Alphaproteobacteria bacterium]MBL7097112.1 tRNA epoxyqueuosine(34) reductase QueG [Alphaproteobacteria bacterium]